MRHKAMRDLEAWNGTRPSLGERVDATRSQAAMAVADVDTAVVDPAVDPVVASAVYAGRPMPPPGAAGSWVWVALPDGAGEVCVRAVAWVRVLPSALSPGGWALPEGARDGPDGRAAQERRRRRGGCLTRRSVVNWGIRRSHDALQPAPDGLQRV